jgi:7-carboxy-7-deazaguanine synthase
LLVFDLGAFVFLWLVKQAMRIAEVYRSIQGEGLLTGVPSVFVRASGCNLRCWFCDTPYTSWEPEGRDMSVDEIVAQVEEWDTEHVVVTGGEPMLFAELIPLCERLHGIRRHITIETAGTCRRCAI